MSNRKKKGRNINGWLLVDKPEGLSSTAVVNKIKWCFDAKKELFSVINQEIDPIRHRYFNLAQQPDLLNDLFSDGAKKVRPQAQQLVSEVRDLVGISKIV